MRRGRVDEMEASGSHVAITACFIHRYGFLFAFLAIAHMSA